MAVHVIYRCDYRDCTSSPVETTTVFYREVARLVGWISMPHTTLIYCPLHATPEERDGVVASPEDAAYVDDLGADFHPDDNLTDPTEKDPR